MIANRWRHGLFPLLFTIVPAVHVASAQAPTPPAQNDHLSNALSEQTCSQLEMKLVAGCLVWVRKAQPAMIDPSGTRALISPVNATQLNASTDDKKKTATARLGLIDGDGKGGSLATQLTISGPLDESGEHTELFRTSNLTSLSDQTTAKLSLNRTQWTFDINVPRLRAVCDSLVVVNDALMRKKALAHATTANRASIDSAIVKDSAARAADRAKGNPYDWCGAGSASTSLPQGDEYDRIMDAAITNPGTPFTFGAFIGTGRTDIKYADATTLADSSSKVNSVSVGGVLGWVLPMSRSVVDVTYDYVRSKKAGKSTQICAPISSTTTLRCRTTTSGAPVDDNRHVVGGEWRKAIDAGHGFGVHLQADLGDAKAFSVEAPIYLIGSAPGGTSGGIVIGYGTEQHKLSLSIFVGVLSAALVPSAGK